MAIEEHLRIVQFFLAVGVLWVWYIFMYKQTRADRLREDLFTIRDELFDYMWQHELSYDLPAYQRMRDFLNGGIRLADQFNLLFLLLLAYFTRDARRREKFTLRTAIKDIDDPVTTAHFEEVYHRVALRLLSRVFLEGPQWLFFKPFAMAVRLKPLRPVPQSVQDSPPAQAMSDELIQFGRRKSPEARTILMTFRTPMWGRPGHV